MPERDRLRRRATAGNYDDGHRLSLETGVDFKPCIAYFRSDRERREAWRVLRDDIMRDWLQERPGTRPHAWWQFESPQPRDSRRWATQREQLEAMGRLTDQELEALS